MPHIIVTAFPMPTERRAELVKNLTETVANLLYLGQNLTDEITVLINPVAPECLVRGGRPLSYEDPGFYHVDLYAFKMSYGQRHELARYLTNALCETLRLKAEDRERVLVTIHAFSPQYIAVGGHLLEELAYA